MSEFEIEDGMIMEYFGNGGRVVIPEGVREIFFEVFEYNYLITEVVIPDSITGLGPFTFIECVNMHSVTFGASVAELGIGTFENCTSLKEIRFRGTREQWEAIEKHPAWDRGAGKYTVIFEYREKG